MYGGEGNSIHSVCYYPWFWESTGLLEHVPHEYGGTAAYTTPWGWFQALQTHRHIEAGREQGRQTYKVI